MSIDFSAKKSLSLHFTMLSKIIININSRKSENLSERKKRNILRAHRKQREEKIFCFVVLHVLCLLLLVLQSSRIIKSRAYFFFADAHLISKERDFFEKWSLCFFCERFCFWIFSPSLPYHALQSSKEEISRILLHATHPMSFSVRKSFTNKQREKRKIIKCKEK